MSSNFDSSFNYDTKFYFMPFTTYIFLNSFDYIVEPNVVNIVKRPWDGCEFSNVRVFHVTVT